MLGSDPGIGLQALCAEQSCLGFGTFGATGVCSQEGRQKTRQNSRYALPGKAEEDLAGGHITGFAFISAWPGADAL